MAGYELESDERVVPTAEPEVSDPGSEKAPESPPAMQRFQSCRWRKASENGVPDHCTHRDVQPIAGTAGFNPESWCPDCSHHKVRRNPRKRPQIPPEDRYYY